MSSSPESSKIDSNVLRILVATDNHLGYREKDIIRGKRKITIIVIPTLYTSFIFRQRFIHYIRGSTSTGLQ